MKDARGVVKSFSKETGEGIIAIEGGPELAFSTMYTFYSDSSPTSDIVIGDTATVSIVLNSMGKRRAQAIHLDRPPPKPLSFTAAFKEMQTLGFLTDWKLADAKRVVNQLYGELPKRFGHEHSLGLLSDYYGTGATDQAVKDGYLSHDWRFGQETNDIVAEFVRALKCPPAKQIKNDSDGVVVRDDQDPTLEITVKDDVRALATFFQSRLDALKIPLRIIEIKTDGDWFAFAVRDESMIQAFRTARAFDATIF